MNKSKSNSFSTKKYDLKKLKIRQDFPLHNQSFSYKFCFQKLFECFPDSIVMLDKFDKIISFNKRFEELFGYTIDEIKGLNIKNILIPDILKDKQDDITGSMLTGEIVQIESIREKKNGTFVNVSISYFPIIVCNKYMCTYVIYSDITARKHVEEKLVQQSIRDPLTNLYNRAYFEEQINNYDLRIVQAGIIICDLDCLKMVNDSLGHKAGDLLLISAANVIKSSVRNADIVARIGGDEFAIFLPYSCKEDVEHISYRLHKNVLKYNSNLLNLPLNISLGWAVVTDTVTTSIDKLFKEADNNMYREKINHHQKTKEIIINHLVSLLKTKEFLPGKHTLRLQSLIDNMIQFMSLSEESKIGLHLLVKYHGIGTVGISDTILFKSSALTPQEIKEIRWHCEIGYRIAHSSPDIIPIEDLILKHHEWWNGCGYPLGLSGINIPLECRIFALVDAYNAMVNFRPYRKTKTHQEAIEEILKFSGTQFDPNLVNAFITVLQKIQTNIG
ncbi:MAG: diguanylate cyclase [Clostridia bacterium]|nr:diguanylate cyclase [Clostridia bacterium]MDD4048156.1 diguanylate cyclase [Clostridia bacterium]